MSDATPIESVLSSPCESSMACTCSCELPGDQAGVRRRANASAVGVGFGVLLIPLGFTLARPIFGNTAISLVLEGGQAILGQVAQSDPPMAVFKLFEYLPIPS